MLFQLRLDSERPMAFHVRDPKTDAAVRKLAAQRGIGITEAVREAAEEALERDGKKLSLWERTADIRARIASYPDTGLKADKAFFDDLWGQGDDD
jgi:antitoxin VapB